MAKEGKWRFIGFVEESGKLSKVKIFPEYCKGLRRVAEYSHIIILYWAHLIDNERRQRLQAIPGGIPGLPLVGIFGVRSLSRPNPIGLCVTTFETIEDCVLTVKGLDALKNSPIIDIKPYIPKIDSVENVKLPEWMKKRLQTK